MDSHYLGFAGEEPKIRGNVQKERGTLNADLPLLRRCAVSFTCLRRLKTGALVNVHLHKLFCPFTYERGSDMSGSQTLVLSLLPTFPAIQIIPTTGEPFAMGAAPEKCSHCGNLTVPVPLSDPDYGWYLPCCYIECSHCNSAPIWNEHCAECDKCESCCYCTTCDYCGSKYHRSAECSDNPNNYEDDCDCEECSPSRRARYGTFTPGWVTRGDVPADFYDADGNPRDTGKAALTAMGARDIDPVESMASYYLLEFMATQSLDTSAAKGSELSEIIREAKAEFTALVNKLDPIFQTYAFCAIGGELRHGYDTRGSDIPGSRGSAWDYWHLLGMNNDMRQLTADALEAFQKDSWTSGYGGSAWATCTDVLLGRLDGRYSPALFCDRMFSIQHNGGSFLNKYTWKTSETLQSLYRNVEYCQEIGNAHAATQTDWRFLMGFASSRVRSLFSEFWTERNKYLRTVCLPMEILPDSPRWSSVCQTIRYNQEGM